MQDQTINPFSLLEKTLGSILPIYFPLLVIVSPGFSITAAYTLSLPSINVILMIISVVIYPLLLGTQVCIYS